MSEIELRIASQEEHKALVIDLDLAEFLAIGINAEIDQEILEDLHSFLRRPISKDMPKNKVNWKQGGF